MSEEKIIFQGKGIVISEDTSNPDYLQGKFCVCDFDINKNNVRLNRKTIDNWVATLIGSPLVAKIAKNLNGESDFTSHNLKIIKVKGKDGKMHKQAVFDTEAFGVCTDVSIETAEDGNDYIYANYKIWKRFQNACKIIKERCDDLHTSWEISVTESTSAMENGEIIKTINNGRFIGLAMLGSGVSPAYDSSGLLSVASETENELNTALIEDLENLDISSDITKIDDKEVKVDMEKDNVIETNVSTENTEEVVEQSIEKEIVETQPENVDNSECKKDDDEKTKKSECDKENDDNKQKSEVEKSENNTETSALTDNDLRRKLELEFDKQVDTNGVHRCGWCFMMFPADNVAWFRECGSKTETELTEVKYTVENDNVVINECNAVVLTVSPREINQVVAQKDSAIVEMSAQIQTLNDKVAELQPYKDKVDEIEKAEREAQFEKDKKELSDYAISSGYITQNEVETSEEIIGFINALDKASIKSLIADRVVASLSKKEQEVEISETNNTKEPNIQINLSAKQTDEEKSTKDVSWIIKSYLGK